MNRREQMYKYKSDIIKIAWCLAAVIIVALFVIFAVSHIAGGSKSTFAVSDYSVKVTINSVNIRAYKVSDSGPYIVMEELPKTGLQADFVDDENISVYYTDKENITDANLSGENAKLINQKYYVNNEKKGNFLKQYSDNKKVIDQIYTVNDLHLVRINDLKNCGIIEEASGSTNTNIAMQTVKELIPKTQTAQEISGSSGNHPDIIKPAGEQTEQHYQIDKTTVFLDAGHGKSSGLMSESEKTEYGWIQNENGEWGEWRHWRDGKFGTDCAGDDGSISQPNECWYPIENGDRDEEPNINMQNCLSAKTYLEQMGYNVILSRESNYENPSITKRIDDAQNAGAELYICVHSNAGGGSGTAYISLSEEENYYAQHKDSEYAKRGNILGKMINDKIVSNTSLTEHGGGSIDGEPYLILFQKSPITCAYLEIGFFDSESDLSILNSEYDQIGRAIAEGIDEYCASYMN